MTSDCGKVRRDREEMKLTPAILEATYNFVRATPPFRNWRLPAGHQVRFRVLKTRKKLGVYQWDNQVGHVVSVSEGKVSHTIVLVPLMAHEMVHLYQQMCGTDTKTEHNAEFIRLALIVCRHHGFDPKEFT